MTFEEIKANAVNLEKIPREDWDKYIGKGYRSSTYVIGPDRQGYAVLFGYDTNGNPQTFIFPHMSSAKYKVRFETKEKDMFGNFVQTKMFSNSMDRYKWLEGAQGIFFVEVLRPEHEILQELFSKDVLDPSFNTQKLKIFNLDIETEISDKFEGPTTARNRINMITVHDSETGIFHTWSLEHADPNLFAEEPLKDMDKSLFDFRCFDNNEISLLEDFIDWWSHNYPDVVNSWNGKAYDYPYIVRRIENVLTKEDVKRLSPIGKYRIKEVNKENKRAIVGAEIEVELSGIFLADDLFLYRDKFGVKKALDGGYSLNNVGEAEGLGQKIHYEGTLKDLYEKDYQKFYEYNVRDVDLLKRIEDQCKLIPLARRISGAGLCNYDTIYSSITYLIGSLTAFARTEMDGVVFQSYLNHREEGQSYEGAFVFPPKVGRYKKGIAVVDVNSLYPSSIRILNISPETYVGKIIPIGSPEPDAPIDLLDTVYTDFYFKPSNGDKSRMMTKDELLELCKTKCIFTRNNTLFLKHSIKQGIVSAWCKHYYAIRKSTKKKMQELEVKLANGEISEDQIEEMEKMIENLDNAQQSFKIMLNSIYGIMGTSYSPIGNVDLAQSITRTGKYCNMSSSKFITEWTQKMFKLPKFEDENSLSIGGDTDSLLRFSKIFIRSNFSVEN